MITSHPQIKKMRGIAMRIALMLTFVVSTAMLASAEIPWIGDLKSAHQQAQAEGKLLLVHFESDNCVWCDRLEAGAFQSDDVASTISQRYVPVKINASKNPRLAEYFKVNRFPTDVVVDSSGAVHSHTISPQVAGQYVTMLQQAALKGGSPIGASAAGIAAAPVAPQHQGVAVTMPPVAPQQPIAAPPQQQFAANTNQYGMPPGITPIPSAGNSQFQLPTQSNRPPAGNQTVSMQPNMGGPIIPSIQQNLGTPANTTMNNFAITAPTGPAQSMAPPAAALPELAMDGYCAVSILEETKWVEGDKRFGAIHLGKLYLFANADGQAKFLADPEKFTPALGGMDVVRFIDGSEEIEGVKEYGVAHRGRLYFFSTEDSLKTFFQSPEAYSVPAQEMMRQATTRAIEDLKLR